VKSRENRAIMIADLGYGDAGKGSIVDYLTRETQAHTVIRYNGGAQAAHNVITPDGRHHTFAQFGSGTFIPGTRTHLSRFMMVHPLAMLAEERHLQTLGIPDAFVRTSIDRKALVTTPFQQSANRIREMARGDGRHGSCGMGVGETMSDWLVHGGDVLFAGDLSQRALVMKKLGRIRDIKTSQLEIVLKDVPQNDAIDEEMRHFHDPQFMEAIADVYLRFTRQVKIVEPDFLGRLINQPGVTIFEGAQGVLLDEWYGFYPYNSWSTLTFKNAETLLTENDFMGETLKLGLIRGYATRHGAGPFVTEDRELTSRLQDHHNKDNPWQQEFRAGHLDFVALRYALDVIGKVDRLVVTNLDRMEAFDEWQTCNRYQSSEMRSNLEECFGFDGWQVNDIKVPADPTDLVRQGELTRLLFTMQPDYDRCGNDVNAYMELISQTLKLPIAITSFGPTASDKKHRELSLYPVEEMMAIC
jgi:adenylosuccinate synthase